MSMTDWFPTCEVRTARDLETLKKLGSWFSTEFEPIPGKGACTWFLDSEIETPIAVVYVKEGISGNQLSAIVAHEATHCTMDYMKSIGEEEFSAEFVAYVVQSFTLEILARLGVK